MFPIRLIFLKLTLVRAGATAVSQAGLSVGYGIQVICFARFLPDRVGEPGPIQNITIVPANLSNGGYMRKKAVGASIVLGAFFVTPSVWGQKGIDGDLTTKVTPVWQAYFRKIRSIRFDSILTAKVPKDKINPLPTNLTLKMKFVANGNKFYTRIVYPKGSPLWEFSTAYNGKEYQSLMVSEDGPVFDKGNQPPSVYYNGTEPFTQLYAFAFEAGQAKNLTTLQSEQTWRNIASRTSGWIASSQQGKKGHLLTILSDKERNEATERYEVFVDEESGLPLSWKRFSNITNKLIAQLEVTKWITKSSGGANFSIPISFERKLFVDEADVEIDSTMNIDLNPNSIMFNRPVSEQTFALSQTQIAPVN